MEWINENLFDDYDLIGDIDDHVVRLIITHPNGTKIVRTKHMAQIDIDNSDLDDIRRHFSRMIGKIQSMTLEQLQLICGSFVQKEK